MSAASLGLGKTAYEAAFQRGRAMTTEEGVALAVEDKQPQCGTGLCTDPLPFSSSLAAASSGPYAHRAAAPPPGHRGTTLSRTLILVRPAALNLQPATARVAPRRRAG